MHEEDVDAGCGIIEQDEHTREPASSNHLERDAAV